MSHFDDLHQISGISSISTISQSSSRLISKVDSSFLLDNYSSAVRSNDRLAISQETSAIEKAISSLVLCEENISEHIKTNIVYQCIKKASLSDKDVLSKSTASKLRTLLLIHDLDKYMHLPSTTKHMQDKLVLLGIIDLPQCDLNPDERLEVKCCIETMLREMIHDVMLRYEALGGNGKEASKSSECNMHNKFMEYYDMPVVRWKNKNEDLIVQCESDLMKYMNLIDKWNKLKYENVSQAYLQKTGHLLLQAQVAELQAKITKLSCTFKMFSETPSTVDAFKMLNRLVEGKLKTVTDEIRQKEDLKEQYDNLKNTEYDQVLLMYSQLCNAIKKKRHILDMLK